MREILRRTYKWARQDSEPPDGCITQALHQIEQLILGKKQEPIDGTDKETHLYNCAVQDIANMTKEE